MLIPASSSSIRGCSSSNSWSSGGGLCDSDIAAPQATHLLSTPQPKGVNFNSDQLQPGVQESAASLSRVGNGPLRVHPRSVPPWLCALRALLARPAQPGRSTDSVPGNVADRCCPWTDALTRPAMSPHYAAWPATCTWQDRPRRYLNIPYARNNLNSHGMQSCSQSRHPIQSVSGRRDAGVYMFSFSHSSLRSKKLT